MTQQALLREENEHHLHTSDALGHSDYARMTASQHLPSMDDQSIPHEEKAQRAHGVARAHGKATRKLLRAAKAQYFATPPNRGLAADLFARAADHEGERSEWQTRHSEHRSNDRAQKFFGQLPHRGVHFSRVRGPEEVSQSSHPYDIHRKWENIAKALSDEANSIPPWDKRHSLAHGEAASAWENARKAAIDAGNVTGRLPDTQDPETGETVPGGPTEDYLHYRHRANRAFDNKEHHERKSKI